MLTARRFKRSIGRQVGRGESDGVRIDHWVGPRIVGDSLRISPGLGLSSIMVRGLVSLTSRYRRAIEVEVYTIHQHERRLGQQISNRV